MKHWVDNPTGIGSDESHTSSIKLIIMIPNSSTNPRRPRTEIALDGGVTAALLIVLGLVYDFHTADQLGNHRTLSVDRLTLIDNVAQLIVNCNFQ